MKEMKEKLPHMLYISVIDPMCVGVRYYHAPTPHVSFDLDLEAHAACMFDLIWAV
jgi:hypothetical protein